MKATTVKIEGTILDEIAELKPPAQTLTAFVREALQREVRRRRMTAAAHQYVEHLENNRSEAEWLQDWASADLVSPPRARARR